MPVQCTCSTCGKLIVRKPSKVLPKNFCSAHCSRSRPPVLPTVSEDGNTAQILLHDRFGVVRGCAIIDATDAAWAGQWSWHLTGKGYAGRIAGATDAKPGNVVFLHRELLGLPQVRDGVDGDHINRNKLDCRRSNLRVAPNGLNAQNKPPKRRSTSPWER